MSKEMLEVLDSNGEPTGVSKLRDVIHSTGEWHYSVHVWLRFGDRYLLQKRAEHKESYPGRYDCAASGHVSAGEQPVTGAVRETREEIGLTVKEELFRLLTVHKLCYDDGRGFVSNEFNYVFLVEYDPCMGELTPEEGEITELRWVTMEELAGLMAQDVTCIDEEERQAVAGAAEE